MASFCHFWKMTPEERRRLKMWEYEALVNYQNDMIEKQNKQNGQGKTKRS